MKRLLTAALVGASISTAGCGNSDPQPAAATKVSIARAAATEPLTEDDVLAFLEIVPQLPDRTPPGFRPVAPPQFVEKLSGKELATLWRSTFQSAYLPATQARLWRKETRLMDAIEDADVEPEVLASLLLRLSSAVSRRAIDDSIDLVHMRKKADLEIARLCRQLDDEVVRNAELRADLADSLREAVAFREFVRLLEAVPQESVRTVARFKNELALYLPTADTVTTFERYSESTAVVLPSAYARPAAPGPEKTPAPPHRGAGESSSKRKRTK